MKIAKVALLATAFVFAAGCAHKPAPAPAPTMGQATTVDAGVKHKKHVRHHHKDKLGTVSATKDTAK